jgi:cbb3-type cytochrome oxidase maturation protein
MEALFLLVPLSIVIVFVAIWLFFCMSDSGQFDDMLGPPLRVIHDDDTAAGQQSRSDEASGEEPHPPSINIFAKHD